MVRRPVPDILKGKLNDAQKSIQAAAWCACGAATLSKFINDTKYSLTRSRGANIGFLVTKLDVRRRQHLGLALLLLQVLVRGVLHLTAAQLISQPIAASYGCW